MFILAVLKAYLTNVTSHVHVYLETLDSYGFRLIIIRTAGLDSYPEMCVPNTSYRSLNDVLDDRL